MRKYIVFDLGGVLLDWNPRYLYRQIFEDRDEMEFFLREICSLEWNAQMDRGKPFQQAVNELAREHPRYQKEIQAYHSRWPEMMGGEFPETVQILQELNRNGSRLAALSNWSAETFPHVRGQYAFLDWFEPLLLSGEVGTAKPAPQIYRIFIEKTGWREEQCLFIDDQPENIQEASRQGWDTHHYQTSQGLRNELKDRGLLE